MRVTNGRFQVCIQPDKQYDLPMNPLPEYEPVYRRNFPIFTIDNILFSVALGILGTTTVIPDFVGRLTESEILVGLSGNIFTIGFTLPQLFVAHRIVGYARKKWWFVVPNIPVRFVVLIFAGLVVWLGAERLGLILILFFICYGIAALGDGLVGVPWVDLIGSSLDDKWRARMFGIAAAVTGIIMLLLTPLIGRILGPNGPTFPNNYALLFAISGVIFVISILPGILIDELPGGKAVEERPSFAQFLPQLSGLVGEDSGFRAFLVARILTILLLMAAPFYIGFATGPLDLSSEVAVPVLLAMQTVGSVIGALAYAWLGARNNLRYLQFGLVSAALLPVCAMLAAAVGPWPLYGGFLLSGLAAGSNLSLYFLDWLVGYADADARPIYVGLVNTITAVVSFLTPFVAGTIVQRVGYLPLFGLSLLMAVGALWVTGRFFPKGETSK